MRIGRVGFNLYLECRGLEAKSAITRIFQLTTTVIFPSIKSDHHFVRAGHLRNLNFMRTIPPSFVRFAVILASAAAAFSADAITTNTLPASLAAPLNSSTNRGFVVRTAQAWSTNGPVANSYIRAFKQINGTLVDTNNALVLNAANPGPNTDGSYFYDTINFDKDAAFVNVTDENGGVVAAFSPDYFPGIPGQEASTENFVVEAICYLSLPAGTTVLGISTAADRTDANDDDSYNAFVAPHPRDFFGTRVSVAERHTGSAFAANQHLETQLVLIAPQAGIYPFRILYWQTGLAANLQFYSIDANENRVLVNDPNDPNALVAYRDSNRSAANGPYTGEVSPLPGSAGIPATAPVTALLFDGLQTTVTVSSVSMSLNGAAATLNRSK